MALPKKSQLETPLGAESSCWILIVIPISQDREKVLVKGQNSLFPTRYSQIPELNLLPSQHPPPVSSTETTPGIGKGWEHIQKNRDQPLQAICCDPTKLIPCFFFIPRSSTRSQRCPRAGIVTADEARAGKAQPLPTPRVFPGSQSRLNSLGKEFRWPGLTSENAA